MIGDSMATAALLWIHYESPYSFLNAYYITTINPGAG
jgi:hypothetical protein